MPLTTLSFNEGAACAEKTEFLTNISKIHVLPTVINSAAAKLTEQDFILCDRDSRVCEGAGLLHGACIDL